MAAQRPLLRIILNVVLDFVLAALAVPLAAFLSDPSGPWAGPVWLPAAGAACLLLAGMPFRLPQQYWRFAGIGDLMGVAGASALAAMLLALLTHAVGHPPSNPAEPAILALTLLVLLGTPRVIYRRAQMRRPGGAEPGDGIPVLLVGAGEDADLFLRALAGDRRRPFRVIGLLAQGSRQTGRRIQGHPILGSIDDAPAVLDRLRRRGAAARPARGRRRPTWPARRWRCCWISRSSMGWRCAARRGRRRSIRRRNRASRRISSNCKPVAIEDLLNRPQVPLDRDGMARLIQGRRVIVTGAGGTIGVELARQVAALGPELLVLLDNGEYALWQIDLELAENHPQVPAPRACIADIRDEARIRGMFERCGRNWCSTPPR